MKVIYDTELISNENKRVLIEVIDNADRLDLMNRYELRITINDEVNTLNLTDETRRALTWKPSPNSLRYSSTDKVDDLTYKDPNEVCDYEACENPLFAVDFEGNSLLPVLTEEGEKQATEYFIKNVPFLELNPVITNTGNYTDTMDIERRKNTPSLEELTKESIRIRRFVNPVISVKDNCQSDGQLEDIFEVETLTQEEKDSLRFEHYPGGEKLTWKEFWEKE